MIIRYLALALTWGSSFFLLALALTGFGVAQAALGRAAIGAVTLILLSVLLRVRLPRGAAAWGHLAVSGIFLCAIPFVLTSWGQQYVPVSLAVILNATTPLMTLAVTSLALRGTSLTPARVVGIGVGAVGVFVALGGWTALAAGGEQGFAPLAFLAATFSYGVGFTYVSRFVTGRIEASPIAMSAIQVGGGALVLALVTGPVAFTQPATPTLVSVLGLVGLGALGTGIAYVWNFQIVTAWGPALASTVTYLVPIVGIALGVIVLGERLSWNEPVGAVVVVIGILIAGRRRRPAVSGTAVPETTTTAFPTARVAGTDSADTPGTVDVPTAGTPKPLGCGVGERCAAEQ